MGAKAIKEYFLIKEEKWNCHHFPLFAGQFVCSAYTHFYITHTCVHSICAYGAHARTYTPPHTPQLVPGFLRRLKNNLKSKTNELTGKFIAFSPHFYFFPCYKGIPSLQLGGQLATPVPGVLATVTPRNSLWG